MPKMLSNRHTAPLLRMTFVALIASLPSCHLFVKPPEKAAAIPPSPGTKSAVSTPSVVQRFIPSVSRLEFTTNSDFLID